MPCAKRGLAYEAKTNSSVQGKYELFCAGALLIGHLVADFVNHNRPHTSNKNAHARYVYILDLFVELSNSNLHATLKQLYDSELNTTNKYLTEEELMPLMELPLMELHQNSDATPYFKFVNEKLLQMRDSDSILELLDVDDETKGDVTRHHRRWSSFSNEDNSIVNLIGKFIETSSPQVRYC